MKSRLITKTSRAAYSPAQVRRTMNVGELIYMLESYDEETPVYLSFDDGYTFGGLTAESFDEERIESARFAPTIDTIATIARLYGCKVAITPATEAAG